MGKELGGDLAKRFTDTEKWKRPWFRKLPPKAKVLWQYLCDQCDHCGIWIADFELASFQAGFNFDEAALFDLLGDKIIKIDGDKYFIPSFFEFQYADAKEGFKAKQSAIRTLSKLGLMTEGGAVLYELPNSKEHLPNTSELSMDSPSIGIGKSIGISNTGESEGKREFFDFEALYRKYPRKEGKSAGLKQCRKQIQTRADYDSLSQAIDRYATHVRGKEPQYIKQFSSFLGSDSTAHPWRDWLDPDAGTVTKAAADEPEWVKQAKAEEARRKNAV